VSWDNDQARMTSTVELLFERQINRILLDADSPEAALVEAMRAVCETLGWDCGQYWRLDEADGVLRIHAAWSVDDARVRAALREALTVTCGPGEDLAGEVLRTAQPLWVADLRRDPRFLRQHLCAVTGWNSALLVPVVSQERVIGVLDFTAQFIAKPDGPLLAALAAVGRHTGTFFARTMAVDRLRESEAYYSSLVELAAIGISHVDLNGRFVFVNRRLCEMLGYSREELLELSIPEISHPDDRQVTDKDRARLEAGEIDSFKAEKRYLRRDGSTIWVRLTVAPRRTPEGRTLHHISIVEDISDRRKAEARIQYLATHDEMTGLVNRTMFGEFLARAIARCHRPGRGFAVMFVDLDRFKVVNDSLGHEAGDELLRVIALRLRTTLRTSDVVARFGGDEFVLLLENLSSPSDAAVLAKKALACFEEPFLTDGHELHISASIGVSVYPEDGNDAETLVKNADTAMYRAKERGRGTYCFYTAQMNAQGTERLMLESGLRRAVDRGELELHYQPKLELGSQRIVGVEALMRWRHPALGMVSPAQFIPIAEETGLIEPIGRWALERACADAVAWRALGLPALQMSVNVSPRQLNSRSIINEIRGILDSTGLEPELLELEITEGAMMKNPEHAVKLLEDIRAMGVGLAIDDFGTGYSSLSYLRRFPLSTVKIDRAFINDVSENADAQALVDSIITLAHGLRMKVVAEGVETMVQLDHLRSRGCDEIQGFLLCKPLPRDELCKFVLRHISTPFASPIAA
jgi:diguanylate cyclase (GGDEF)-like protein/PAS domain S-box-containing protein